MSSNFSPALSAAQARAYSPLALAFIGDGVYETFIRTKILLKGNMSANKLHKEAVCYVRAKAQSEAIRLLLPYLTDEEEAVFKRGRNAHSATVPKHADVTDYRYATGFESLLGYLYLTAQSDRLTHLMEEAYKAIDAMRFHD
ncbi:MAG: Mini-ribonuclease 3 [Ruminococcaceae bacterium]|nr:Mini-ribonuclease 3 [Oscillospiraceae bacterium]